MDIRKFLSFGVFLACLSFSQVVLAGELPYDQYDANGDLSYDARYLYSDHFEAAYWMKEWGIFDGYADGTFGTLDEINRAELAKVLVLSTGVDDEYVEVYVANYDAVNGTDDYFWDLDMNAWYVKYVRYAQIQGWVSGYEDGSYKPGYIVLVAEAMKMILESQYGTPGEEYAGYNWYDSYSNVFLDTNIIYQSDGGYLKYSFNGDSVGFDSDLDSKMTRKDALELIYRLRVVLEDGDGGIVLYDPLITIDEYESIYGATVSEVEDGVLTIEDPYFGLNLQNVYIGDFDIDDLRIYIENPSGYNNSWYSTWYLMYPTIQPTYLDLFYYIDGEGGIDYSYFFGIPVSSVFESSPFCVFDYNVPSDLTDIYYTLCGYSVTWDDDNSVLVSLLNGSSEFVFPGESLLSVFVFSSLITDSVYDLHSEFYDLSGFLGNGVLDSGDVAQMQDSYDQAVVFLANFDDLYDLQSENSLQQEALFDWLSGYETYAYEYLDFFNEAMTSYSYDESLASAYSVTESDYIESLESLVVDYEKEFLSFDENFVLDVPFDYSDPVNNGYRLLHSYGGSVLVSGDVEESFVDVSTLYVFEDSEFDIWDGLDGVTFDDDKWIRVTLSGTAFESDDNLYGNFPFASMSLVDHASQGYYYKILDMEWVEE